LLFSRERATMYLGAIEGKKRGRPLGKGGRKAGIVTWKKNAPDIEFLSEKEKKIPFVAEKVREVCRKGEGTALPTSSSHGVKNGKKRIFVHRIRGGVGEERGEKKGSRRNHRKEGEKDLTPHAKRKSPSKAKKKNR